jgi:hypothetical protein
MPRTSLLPCHWCCASASEELGRAGPDGWGGQRRWIPPPACAARLPPRRAVERSPPFLPAERRTAGERRGSIARGRRKAEREGSTRRLIRWRGEGGCRDDVTAIARADHYCRSSALPQNDVTPPELCLYPSAGLEATPPQLQCWDARFRGRGV